MKNLEVEQRSYDPEVVDAVGTDFIKTRYLTQREKWKGERERINRASSHREIL